MTQVKDEAKDYYFEAQTNISWLNCFNYLITITQR